MLKLSARELRETKSDIERKLKLTKNPVYIILDNVMDTYNVGAIFRLADSIAASKVYLCGMTETPPNSRIKKASINTTEWVDWEYSSKVVDVITKLKHDIPGIKIFAIEQDERSVLYNSFEYEFPCAFIVGHETHGVSQETLSSVDRIVEIPMWGINKSMNVMVSLGVVLFEAMKGK